MVEILSSYVWVKTYRIRNMETGEIGIRGMIGIALLMGAYVTNPEMFHKFCAWLIDQFVAIVNPKNAHDKPEVTKPHNGTPGVQGVKTDGR